MKKLFLILFVWSSVFSASIFTLENMNNIKIYFANNTDFLTIKEIDDIKKTTQDKLIKLGLDLNKVDAATLMIKVESMEVDESYVIVITLALGEEILTHRKDSIESFAWTYYKTDFIESYEPNTDTIESVNNLVDEFIKSYLDDME